MSTLKKIPVSTAVTVLAVVVFLTSCGDSGEEAPQENEPTGAVPGNVVPLPKSGEITTSAPGVPKSQFDNPSGNNAAAAPQQNQGSRYVQLTPEQQQQLVNKLLTVEARQQAAGLGGGSVMVNGAWDYTGFTGPLSLNPDTSIEARFVAVDITVKDHTTHFDFDDIEIVDGVTGASYGSDPHTAFLTPEGKILKEDDVLPVAPAPTRILLIYAFPKKTPTFTLSYWHKNIVRNEKFEFSDSGLSLPYPATPE